MVRVGVDSWDGRATDGQRYTTNCSNVRTKLPNNKSISTIFRTEDRGYGATIPKIIKEITAQQIEGRNCNHHTCAAVNP